MKETETGESTLHILRILKEERSLSKPEICHKFPDAKEKSFIDCNF